MASAIESLVFFSVSDLKGGRYVGIRSIFAMGVLETYPSINATMPQNVQQIYNKNIGQIRQNMQAQERMCTFNC